MKAFIYGCSIQCDSCYQHLLYERNDLTGKAFLRHDQLFGGDKCPNANKFWEFPIVEIAEIEQPQEEIKTHKGV